MSSKRLFISIPPSAHLVVALTAYAKEIGYHEHIHWTTTENIHMTVLFLGNVKEAHTPLVIKAVEKAAKRIHPFALTFERFTLGPPGKRKYMFWARFKNNPSFTALAAAFKRELRMASKEHSARIVDLSRTKPPLPHITLARMKKRTPRATFPKGEKLAGETTEVHTIELLESHEKHGERIYTPLATFPLGS